MPEYVAAKNIAFYLHMDHGELQTKQLIAHAFEDGKRVFLPRISLSVDPLYKQYATQTSELQMLRVPSLQAVESLIPVGKYNIREPNDGTDGKFCL